MAFSVYLLIMDRYLSVEVKKMEKTYIEINHMTLSFLGEDILHVPRLAVHPFDRIGIVGKNGAGKSSLLKVMSGALMPSRGQVKRFVDFAYFDQLVVEDDQKIDYDLQGKLEIPKTKVESFSGGEQTRLKLAQIFSTYHDMLLLDEPTTHLDASGVQFFLDQLEYYYGALVIVSHDRSLLDKLVTKIWEVADGKVTEYVGNYSAYAAKKELETAQQMEQHEQYVKEKSRLLQAAEEKIEKAAAVTTGNKRLSKRDTKASANRMFMTKSKDTSQKSIQRAAKALEKRIEQLDKVDAPEEEQALRFHLSKALKLHNKFPIMAEELTLQKGKKTLLKDANFQFPLGKTIAISGSNGVGKSTLLRHIIEDKEALTISPKAVIGYYGQMDYYFKTDEDVLSYIKGRSEAQEGKIRAALHRMAFTARDLSKNVHDLSGGEKIRLVLCQLFLGAYNIIILDEPTTFLDMDCLQALETFIHGYEGTVIVVSHDDTFIQNVAKVFYLIEDKQMKRVNE